MDVDRLFASLERDPALEGSVRVVHRSPVRAARRGSLPDDLPDALRRALHQTSITALYTHQRRALELARAGRSFVVSTPTASGKSLCFHLPVLEARHHDPSARALYLHPTKALSRDQWAGFEQLVERSDADVAVHVYDGDTPPEVRRALREEADVVFTNPSMLHAGILPHHAKWASLFSGLRFVVLDELHTLKGVFGSHVGNVLRRLRRLAHHYGSQPTFLFASATIGNPAQLAERLIESPVESIDEDGSPAGERVFAFVQPPVVHRAFGIRRSAVQQTAELARPILAQGAHAIFFERTRNGVEILLKYLRDLAPEAGLRPDQVRGYRGGYLPDLRREIEAGLRDGSIRVVVATNALELGIDIGSLDVAVLVGYPGSLASTFQRAGRAGRREGASAVFLVGRSVALDQYVVHHPEHLFAGAAEEAAVDPDNLVILARHLECAAFELPFTIGERFGRAEVGELLEYLHEEAKVLVRVDDRYFYADQSFPADNVSLTSGDIDNFVVLDAERKTPIGEVDRASAASTIHPEAIYNLQGEQYYVESMDYGGRRATARRVDVDYYTQAEVEAEVRVLDDLRRRSVPDAHEPVAQLHFAELSVRKITTMYKKVRFYTRENIGAGDIHLPPEELDTEGVALVLPRALFESAGLHAHARGAALQGLAELLRQIVPLWVAADPADVGTSAEMLAPHFQSPTLFLWDETPGGIGLSEAVYQRFDAVLVSMREVVDQCACEAGCPGCVGPSLAEGRREKRGARRLLAALCGECAGPAFPLRLLESEG